MNTQTKWVIGLSIALSLVIGILIGKGLDARRMGPYGSHRMPDGMMMSNSGDMSSMMHDMNAALVGKTGDAFDKEFLIQMVVHHEGAVDMAKKVLEVSKRPELIKLANDIISAQTKEIQMMNTWKTTWFK
jgi:uncharacterized protein (DUF305 family)